MKNITLGSLFDGSGGFPLGAIMNGIEPRWASEIVPYLIAVTKSRFPNMKHLGDINIIKGNEIEPVDIITFGSPCQDLSIAGKQVGIHEGERSNLFFQAIRIIKEMREATNGEYPRFAIWENVCGAFISSQGDDFRCVLEALSQVKDAGYTIPRPTDGKWAAAGEIVADGFSIAWRQLDAQYWGVSQRRKRIYLVTDFTGQSAGKILFECRSLSRSNKSSRETWETYSRNIENRFGKNNSCQYSEELSINYYNSWNDKIDYLNSITYYNYENANYLTNKVDKQKTAYGMTAGGFSEILENKANTLMARDYKMPQFVYYFIFSNGYIIRKLTPTEYARLQGFPDYWGYLENKIDMTEEEVSFWIKIRNEDASIRGIKSFLTEGKTFKTIKKQIITWYNKLYSNSNEYKMWGNGIALPCVYEILCNLISVVEEEDYD